MTTNQQCHCGWLLPADFCVSCNGKTHRLGKLRGLTMTVTLTCPSCGETWSMPSAGTTTTVLHEGVM